MIIFHVRIRKYLKLITPVFGFMSTAYFINATHNVNLVIVDWGRGANTANYVTARRRVEIVGRYVAQCIEFMVRHGRLNLKTTTLIGHSLGAHVSGFGMFIQHQAICFHLL